MADPAISAKELGKRYRLGRLESGFRRAHRAILRRPDHGHIWALRDLSFEVPRGSSLAIVGSNGAGKSTLLKVLARITEPTTGYVDVAGRVGALIEVGTGFSAELTGRENIYLNGTLLGMSRRDIDRRLDEIVAFAGVEQHLDKPVKWYSSGMYIRLGFAVAAHLEPDILIVDEVLSVGDLAFQQKCLGRMGELSEGGRTVLFVSHNLAAVSAICPTAMYLKDGEISLQGSTRGVISRYVDDVRSSARVDLRSRADRGGNGRLRFTDIRVGNGSSVMTGEDCEISLHYMSAPDTADIRVGLTVYGALVEPIVHCSSDQPGNAIDQLGETGSFTCTIPRLPLLAGHYTLSVFCEIDGEIADWVEHAAVLEVVQGDFFGTGRLPSHDYGTVCVDHTWTGELPTATSLRLSRSAS